MALARGVASAQQGEVLWLGHSAFRITSGGGKVIVIDPFLTSAACAGPRYIPGGAAIGDHPALVRGDPRAEHLAGAVERDHRCPLVRGHQA